MDKQAQEIFDRYNPADKVTPCPEHKKELVKELSSYAQYTVNLYGLINLNEFVDIFNSQNDEKAVVDEIIPLLLPIILNSKPVQYAFYKDLLVHDTMYEKMECIEIIQSSQENKPRYIPSKEILSKHTSPLYEETNHWELVRSFIFTNFGESKETWIFYHAVYLATLYGDNARMIKDCIIANKIDFKTEKQLLQFVELLFRAKANTRIWENKGYTRKELAEMEGDFRFDKPFTFSKEKIGVNEACRCGSNKKYKKCCMKR